MKCNVKLKIFDWLRRFFPPHTRTCTHTKNVVFLRVVYKLKIMRSEKWQHEKKVDFLSHFMLKAVWLVNKKQQESERKKNMIDIFEMFFFRTAMKRISTFFLFTSQGNQIHIFLLFFTFCLCVCMCVFLCVYEKSHFVLRQELWFLKKKFFFLICLLQGM